MVHYSTPMPPKLNAEIWDYKNTNSKAIEHIIFNLNCYLLVGDKPINQKVRDFKNTLLHVLLPVIPY